MNLLELTQKIVSIPSFVDNNNDESVIADFLFDYLQSSLKRFTVEKQYIDEKRFNIIALTSKNPKIIFISHMDTVLPSENKAKNLIKNNKLFGLGSCDMKAGLSSSIIACQNTQNNNVGLILDCDEEYSFKGIKKIISEYKFKPEIVIFPEPTNLQILNGCRGLLEISFNVFGKSAHASTPTLGKNAIENTVYLVDNVKRMLPKNSSINLSYLNGGKNINKNVVVQANSVPDIAKVLIDIRFSKSISSQQIIKLFFRQARKQGIKIKNFKINLNYPPFETPKKNLRKIISIIKKKQNATSYSDFNKTGFFEASFIAKKWACPIIAFGPGPKEKAHQKNEFVYINQLKKTTKIFEEIIKSY